MGQPLRLEHVTIATRRTHSLDIRRSHRIGTWGSIMSWTDVIPVTRESKVCAYCGRPATTADHVPPRGLFARPLPADVITVPSCSSCNNNSSKDDEYFRTVMSVRHDTFDHPDASAAAQRQLTRFNQPGSAKFAKSFVSGVNEVEIRTSAGLYLGQAGEFTADMRRVSRVVERIVRGLHFHHHRSRIPDTATLSVYPADSIAQSNDPVYINLLPAIEWAARAHRHVVGNDVLEYKFRNSEDDRLGAAWLLQFYRRVGFLALLADRGAPSNSVLQPTPTAP
jgi:hypothetical protein